MSPLPDPTIHTIFEPITCTWQYIVVCPATHQAAIIDSVLDFDPTTNTVSTKTAESLLSLITDNNYTITHILETHAHADHLTASYYLKQRLTTLSPSQHPKVCIGNRISIVQLTFVQKYSITKQELENVFDHLWSDNEEFNIGNLKAKVLYLPGHTPDHVGYMIGGNIFTGDSIFNPDVGSARCDFPGGDANALWESMNTLLKMPEETKLFTGHDYPPGERGEGERAWTTVKEQREGNKHVKVGTREDDFVSWRKERDGGLGEPRLLGMALQVNVRGGRMPGNGMLLLPIKGERDVLATLEVKL